VKTIVHLLRHGEVDNPSKVLYGRLPGYHLSPLGRKMAERIAESVAERKIVHLVASPLERAQETAQPIATAFGMPIVTDERLIEAANIFEGQRFGLGDGSLRHPKAWWHLRNPLRPSWGEPYRDIVVRMLAAMGEARKAAEGREALLVSHQLPIWIVRSYVEGRRLWHDPRKRECTLASLTSFVYDGDRIASVEYTEPAGDLLPVATRQFVAGA
jgi:broad specificity phosphatase PhoE